MKENSYIHMKDLCARLKRTSSQILKLALTQKLHLWLDFEHVDVYNNDKNGTIQVLEKSTFIAVRPDNEVLESFLLAENNKLETSNLDEEFNFPLSLSENAKGRVFKEEGYSGLQQYYPTDLDTSIKIIAKEQNNEYNFSYFAFPAVTDNNEPVILKQIGCIYGKIAKTKHCDIYIFISLKMDDLYALERDVIEFERSQVEDYYIGRQEILGILGLGDKSHSAINYHLKKHGVKPEYTDEPHPRPMVKKTDILKILGSKRKKKNN